MRVLGIETSSEFLSVAIVDKGGLIAEYNSNFKVKDVSLLPLIKDTLEKGGISLEDLGGVSVSLGPGSFTGLRIGIATAKAISLARGLPIAGIPTLDALVQNLLPFSYQICAFVDARRSLVYCCLYKNLNGRLKRITKYLLSTLEDILKMIKEPTIFVGDGIKLYKDRTASSLGGKAKFSPRAFWYPKAQWVAKLGREKILMGKSDDPYEISPLYLYPKECSVTRKK